MTDPTDCLLTQSAARQLCGGVSAMCFWRWRKAGILPPPVAINGRLYWKRSALAAFIDQH
jgi:predicted DNA-binding transcriptional regulator AlpA